MEFLSVKELQEVLGVSRNTAYEFVRSGQVPAIRVGKSYRIPKDLFEAWVTRQANLKTGCTTHPEYKKLYS